MVALGDGADNGAGVAVQGLALRKGLGFRGKQGRAESSGKQGLGFRSKRQLAPIKPVSIGIQTQQAFCLAPTSSMPFLAQGSRSLRIQGR